MPNLVRYQRSERLRPINEGQRELFKAITTAANNGQTLYKHELLTIYQVYVQAQTYRETDLYDHEKGEWYRGQIKIEDWYLDQLFNSWLLRALGALIKKGYLSVLPRLNLSNLPVKESKKVIEGGD